MLSGLCWKAAGRPGVTRTARTDPDADRRRPASPEGVWPIVGLRLGLLPGTTHAAFAVEDLWCSLECTPACQAGGRGFKSRQVRQARGAEERNLGAVACPPRSGSSVGRARA